MPYKRIRIYGKRYVIVPSLDNMCAVEEQTKTNLIQGVNANSINLCFMRAVLSNIIEREDGTHIEPETLDRLYKDDVSTAQKLFADCYQQMYHFPNIPQKRTLSLKKVIALLRIFVRRQRAG